MASNKKTQHNCKRYLVLKSDRDDFEQFFIRYMQEDNIDTYPLYKKNKGILWYLQVIWIKKLNLPFQSFFYNSWKKKIAKYDTVIVFDRNLNWNILKWIERKNPISRKIAWLWNVLTPAQIPSEHSKTHFEIWSFDKNQCAEYGFKHNTQFYVRYKSAYSCPLVYDAIFIGKDKNRYHICQTIFKMLQSCGYKVFEGIVSDETSNSSKQYIAPITYEKVLELIASSSCIIDIPKAGQSGLTMRVLESLFLGKKMITTDITVGENDFYNPHNIFIWQNPTPEEIKSFFSFAYEPIDPALIEKYSFGQWVKNFE